MNLEFLRYVKEYFSVHEDNQETIAYADGSVRYNLDKKRFEVFEDFRWKSFTVLELLQ